MKHIVVICGPEGNIEDYMEDEGVELIILQYQIPIGEEPSDLYIEYQGEKVVFERGLGAGAESIAEIVDLVENHAQAPTPEELEAYR